jgi:hypothetical protein
VLSQLSSLSLHENEKRFQRSRAYKRIRVDLAQTRRTSGNLSATAMENSSSNDLHAQIQITPASYVARFSQRIRLLIL